MHLHPERLREKDHHSRRVYLHRALFPGDFGRAQGNVRARLAQDGLCGIGNHGTVGKE